MTGIEITLAVFGIVGTLAGSLGGVALGRYLGSNAQEKARRRRLSALWGALEAEITMCGKQSRKFLGIIENEDKYFLKHRDDVRRIRTPDYRFPSVAFRSAIPALIADGEVSNQDIEPLVEFYNQVERINRGFDNAAAWRMSEIQGTPSGWEFDDQLDCNIRYAINLTPGSVLQSMSVKSENTRLSPTVRGYWEKGLKAPSLFDNVMAAVESHRP